jgi:hypothetical protein
MTGAGRLSGSTGNGRIQQAPFRVRGRVALGAVTRPPGFRPPVGRIAPYVNGAGTGLIVRCELDTNSKVSRPASDDEIASFNVKGDDFHPDRNTGGDRTHRRAVRSLCFSAILLGADRARLRHLTHLAGSRAAGSAARPRPFRSAPPMNGGA